MLNPLKKEFVKALEVVGNVSEYDVRLYLILTGTKGKRRKIKCQLSSEDVPVCSGCLARGTSCLSQEYPEEREPSNNTQVGERLGRVERLLETLVSKISQYEEEDKVQKEILTPESIGNHEDLTPYNSSTSGPSQEMPLMSLFDNSVVSTLSEVLRIC